MRMYPPPPPKNKPRYGGLMMFKPHILALYLGVSPVALATLPEGVTAGTQNIALGEESFASGASSQAVGQGTIATGGNITPEAFAQEYAQYKDLIAQMNTLRQEIAGGERQQGIKQLEEQDIQQQLARLEALITTAQGKLDKQAEIALQKQGQETLRQQMQGELDTLQQAFNRNSFNVPGDKYTVYNDNYSSVLNALDWEKLKQPGGRDVLVQDLKTGIERDFGSRVDVPIEKYNQLIDGYINHQGNITFLENSFKERLFNDFRSGNFSNTVVLTRVGVLNNGDVSNPKYYDHVGFEYGYLISLGARPDKYDESGDELLLRIVNPKQADYSGAPTFDLPNPPMGTPEEEEWNRLYEDWRVTVHKPWYDKNVVPVIMENKLAESSLQRAVRLLAADPASKVAKLLAQYDSGSFVNRLSNRLALLSAPVLTRSLSVSEAENLQAAAYDFPWSRVFDNAINPIGLTDLQRLEKWHQGQRALVSLIDYNSDEWLFDKEEHRQFVEDKVKPFLTKLEQFTSTVRRLEDTSLTQEERNAIAAEVIEQRQQLGEAYKDQQNYLTGFRPTRLTDESLKYLMVESRDLMLAYQDEALRTLMPISSYNDVIVAVKKAVDQQLQDLADKQMAITQVDNQITALQAEWESYRLTLDEQEASTQKVEWNRRLADKQQELQDLAAQLKTQRNTLLGLNTQLDNSPLGSKGQNAIAQGTQAFASGKDSMAIGYKALAIGDNSIAQGSEAVAKGEHSIALGTKAKSLQARTIAVGHQAIANAEGAIAVGDRAGVGKKGLNAIAVGTESLVDAENAVGIGTKVKVTGKEAVAVGSSSIVTGNQAVSVGTNSIVTGKTAVSIGSGNQVQYDKAIAIGSNITATAENSVNLGHESVATVTPTAQTVGIAQYDYSTLLGEEYSFAGAKPVGVVTVGTLGGERRIQNVAAGLISPLSTDAINGSQLYGVINALGNSSIGLVSQDIQSKDILVGSRVSGDVVNFSNQYGQYRRLTGVADGVALNDAVSMRQLNREVNRLDRRIEGIEKDVTDVKSSAANAVAMASMPSAALPGQSLLSVGTGHTVNTSALAIGYSHMSPSGKLSYKVNSSMSNRGKFAVGAGFGIAW